MSVMAGKKRNALREYHLLIKRQAGGFAWEIRFDRHAKPIRRSVEAYASLDAADRSGKEALAAVRAEGDATPSP